MNNIYFLGPKGSYSQIVTTKVNLNCLENPCSNFAAIVKNTLSDKNSVGVLPIENLITSNVHENMDFLFKENLTVIAEAYLKIELYLLGLKNSVLDNIRHVYSHPQALAQCADYISSHNFTVNETTSTSSAKEKILLMEDASNAAIGRKELAADGKLIILDENIEKDKYNFTRFLFVTASVNYNKNQWNSEIKNKASIMFRTTHAPGSLAKLLTELASSNFNLTKIESRPIPATNWEYQFWVDIENEPAREIDGETLTSVLKKNTKSYKIIGIYPSGKIYS